MTTGDMAIRILTRDPQRLLNAVYEAIGNDKVKTWSCDDKRNFIHTTNSGQWAKQASLRPKVIGNDLCVEFVLAEARQTEKGAYGVYVGRFTEMLLNNFPDAIATIIVTQPEIP